MNTRKTTVSFETFNDGLVSIHLIDDDGNAGQIRGKFRYAEKTVGAARYYEAMTAKMPGRPPDPDPIPGMADDGSIWQ